MHYRSGIQTLALLHQRWNSYSLIMLPLLNQSEILRAVYGPHYRPLWVTHLLERRWQIMVMCWIMEQHGMDEKPNLAFVVVCCSVIESCPVLCNTMDCRMPDFPVLHSLPEFVQTHVHWVDDAVQPSHPLYISLKELLVSQIVFQERTKKPKEADKAVGKLHNSPSHSPFCVNDFIHN